MPVTSIPALTRFLRALCLVFVFALMVGAPALAAEEDEKKDRDAAAEFEIVTEPVEIDGSVLFRVRGITSFPAGQRAEGIRRRIEQLAADPAFKTEAVQVVDNGHFSSVMGGTLRIMAVTDADAHVEEVSRNTLAVAIQDRIRVAIASYREQRTRDHLLRSGAYSLAATTLLVVLLAALMWSARRVELVVLRRLHGRIRSLGYQSFEIVRAQHVRLALQGLLRGLRVVIALALVVTYLAWVLHLFPWTRGAGDHLFQSISEPLLSMGVAMVHFIPNLVFLIILALAARFTLRLTRLFFDAVERGTVKLTGFETEWSMPTYKLVRVAIVALTLIVAYPYIPGSDSAAFKGVSLFAGVLLSIGSSSAIANIIAGYMITYRRAFKVGDRVKIGDTVGDVVEMRLQVTHLRTLKNEEVVIPNSFILGNQVTNYSSFAARHGLILHTSVGIGYETPWRQVEAMLIEAAARTPLLQKDPPPFVHQTKLGDFAIDYEINAYCDDARHSLEAYSALHRNILDVFNEFGVAIMTPAYMADPEMPKVVPKAHWYEAPAIKRVEGPPSVPAAPAPGMD